MVPRFCEVAVSVPLRKTFTYAVPTSLSQVVEPGSRVVVPFRNRALVGVVLSLSQRAPTETIVREIVEVLDPISALPAKLIELGLWVAQYYVAPPGEVFRGILPPAADIRHERELFLTDAGRQYSTELASHGNRSGAEIADLALLQFCEVEDRPVRFASLKKLPGGEGAAARLVRSGMLEAREVALRRHTRLQKILAWNPEVTPPEDEPARRVRDVLLSARGPLPLPRLIEAARVSRAVIARLEKRGALRSWEEPLSMDEDLLEAEFTPPSNELNQAQQLAVSEIISWLDSKEFTTGLLFGVTGSGKTEVYLRSIEETLARNRTALLLVPEIALTIGIGRLCRAWFGAGVAVLHSALPDVERAREWWRVRNGEARVVVGTRSAVFAPLENLGLVIVDEEQESAYKQEETPRYNGRDVAIVRARMESAVALLGSATPSLESFHHARSGKYRLLQLEMRIENRPLAAVEVVDLREDFRKSHQAGPISAQLDTAIAWRLAEGTQALLLMNRRGFSWFLLCRSCGATVQCENCSISLTYHKRRDRLLCHYCGYSRRAPKTCPKCQSEYVYFVGEGSEQLEEKLRERFPEARVGRLDRDTVRSKREFQKVLGAFASGKLDVLVGTQMVAKGHDFQRVTLVGVVSADTALSLPDFRAAERTFQLLTQVAGRAGRGTLPGTVLVQTYFPEHYAIQHAARQDYSGFFEKELQFRRLMNYPPFTALANLVVRDRKVENAIRWSRTLEGFLTRQESNGLRVLGPSPAPLARLRRDYRFQFLLKSPRRSFLSKILSSALEFCAKKEIPESAILLDVDPLNLL